MTTATTPTVSAPAPGSAFVARSVTVPGFEVRYFEAGEGAPLVVLHGAGGPEFTLALDALAERFRVLLVEMPGYGDRVNEVHQSIGEFAEAIAEIVAAIGIESYHLMGTSFGGAVALHLAVAHPERLVSLVLESPAAFREGATSPAEVPPEQLAGMLRAHPERIPAFAPDVELAARTWPMFDRLLVSRPASDPELAERLPGCGVRTLVLFGDRDGLVPPANGRIYRRLMPSCSYILVHDAAHAIQADRPEAFADVVGDFLTRGWQFLIPEQSTLINP